PATNRVEKGERSASMLCRWETTDRGTKRDQVTTMPAATGPHPSPLPSSRERERIRVVLFHLATPVDVSTPSPGSTGEGWGEGLRRMLPPFRHAGTSSCQVGAAE